MAGLVVLGVAVLVLVLVAVRRYRRRYRDWRIREYRHRQAWQEVKGNRRR